MTSSDNNKQRETNDNYKKQRKRSVFDLEQIRQLEHVFDQITHYPDLRLRQHLTLITKLPDKKIQIWFQNRRAKWRKQHQLVHFGGLHELTVDGHLSFVPTPKPNFVLASPSVTLPNNTSVQQLEQFFYWAMQMALAKNNESSEQTLAMKRNDLISPSHFNNDFISSTDNVK
ncbi:unnamed protein product [Rotaria socialis]|uniref:Homeobox domain-containing protein n=2 Tax=Rotaria socialis TaxID=392032 RepID=A0A818HE14_9BILA|nr:unnamed protein product [Rotaria socialis]CAF3427501.1 unnamed protein product [Rotaria socialis]CAF3504752.1 unnamed protein product [Rotaria socialis]CAF3688375.1 unnamed protein product [Rotaria socialis]CAF4131765.1 unnamed protein product [Rotaria socialis]